MAGTLIAALPDGRLRLQDGPMEVVIGLDGTRAAVAEARRRAATAFDGVLAGLATEWPLLRRPIGADPPPLTGRVACRMAAAVWPLRRHVITPMAAAAGAVAEEILDAIAAIPGLLAAHVSNGDGIALHLSRGQSLRVGLARGLEQAVPEGLLRIAAADPVRGIATCGWPGRRLSRGIADAVTVLAATAAQADAAAAVIADAVAADHPAVRRAPAESLDPDSGLGALPVTVEVGALPPEVVAAALDAGEAEAERLLQRGLIQGALLAVKDAARMVGDRRLLPGG
ncbi:UPF0280 family protein [Roseicella aquatilis]|uniref:UPF0280 family protein n=1 Tax=Roseicella aquatilis TaxID=2527868 RepID=A0A4R4DW35_9PROT|nr:UPF0280 family protein [Roseicella aquatilis]TCZ66751.1 UPF0280 family protein [Roseicella aquatilis]